MLPENQDLQRLEDVGFGVLIIKVTDDVRELFPRLGKVLLYFTQVINQLLAFVITQLGGHFKSPLLQLTIGGASHRARSVG